MFPSAGYFKSTNCPFFVHGLCHRPYCHFRHVSAEQNADSKNVKSILKKSNPSSVNIAKANSKSQSNSNDKRGKKSSLSAQVTAPYDVQVACGINAKETTDKDSSDNEDIQNLTPLQETIIRFYDHKKDAGERQSATVKQDVPLGSNSCNQSSILSENTDVTSHDKKANNDPVVENSVSSNKDNYNSEKTVTAIENKPIENIKDESQKTVSQPSETSRLELEIDKHLGLKSCNTIKKNEDAKTITAKCTVSPTKGGSVENAILISDSSDGAIMQEIKTYSNKKRKKHSKTKKLKPRHETESKVTAKQNLVNSKETKTQEIDTVGFDSHVDLGDSDDEVALRELFEESSPETSLKRKNLGKVSCTQKINHQEMSQPKETVSINNKTSSAKKHSLPCVSTKETELLGLGKKRRIAHESKQAPQRVTTQPTVNRKFPKMVTPLERIAKLQKIQNQQQKGSSRSHSSSSTSNDSSTRQRVAHVPKPEPKTKGGLARPKISLEYGSKVPQNLRQKYLDKIVDEFVRLCSREKSAFKRALEEEKQIYERSSRRQIYVNLCINTIKRLRAMTKVEDDVTEQEPEEERGVDAAHGGKAPLIRISGEGEKTNCNDLNSLTEETFYDHLVKYLMKEEELVDNGYPRPSPGNPNIAIIKDTKCRRPSNSSFSSDQNSKRICDRCGKTFLINEEGRYLTREECIYHHGRMYRRRERGEISSSFSCCQGDVGSRGCCVGKVHVSQNMNDCTGYMTTITNPLAATSKKVFGLDCEMCYTVNGLELTRVTIVDWKLEKVYDTFVKPDRPVVDYNTRFSGVTEENLKGVTTTMREVQAVLISMILKNAILVGHSLESDLKALKLIHSQVVDTAIVFPHRLGPPYKRALRNLMAEHLKKIIQDSEAGHDSMEDAMAALELMQMKAIEDIKRKARNKR